MAWRKAIGKKQGNGTVVELLWGVVCGVVWCCYCAVCGYAVWYCGVLFNTTLLCLYCVIAVL